MFVWATVVTKADTATNTSFSIVDGMFVVVDADTTADTNSDITADITADTSVSVLDGASFKVIEKLAVHLDPEYFPTPLYLDVCVDNFFQ